MFVARLVGGFLAVALVILGGAYVLTRDRRYLRWIRRLLQFALVFACVLMALFVAERLIFVI